MKCDICEKSKGLILKIELYKSGKKVNIDSYFYEAESSHYMPDHYPDYVLICQECVSNWISKSQFVKGYSDFDEYITSLFGKSLEV